MPRHSLSLIAAVAIAAITVSARPGPQVPPPPASPPTQSTQTTPAAIATGTGLIMGRVVDGSSGKPIQGAMVGLTVQMLPGPTGVPTVPQVPGYRPQAVTTGSDG